MNPHGLSYKCKGNRLHFDDGVVYSIDEAIFISRQEGISQRNIDAIHTIKRVFEAELIMRELTYEESGPEGWRDSPMGKPVFHSIPSVEKARQRVLLDPEDWLTQLGKSFNRGARAIADPSLTVGVPISSATTRPPSAPRRHRTAWEYSQGDMFLK